MDIGGGLVIGGGVIGLAVLGVAMVVVVRRIEEGERAETPLLRLIGALGNLFARSVTPPC